MFFRRLYAPILNRALTLPEDDASPQLPGRAAVIRWHSRSAPFMPQLSRGFAHVHADRAPMMSMEQARDVLTKTDGIIMTFRKPQSVLGKSGKFESSTDPARSRCSRRRSS